MSFAFVCNDLAFKSTFHFLDICYADDILSLSNKQGQFILEINSLFKFVGADLEVYVTPFKSGSSLLLSSLNFPWSLSESVISKYYF